MQEKQNIYKKLGIWILGLEDLKSQSIRMRFQILKKQILQHILKIIILYIHMINKFFNFHGMTIPEIS